MPGGRGETEWCVVSVDRDENRARFLLEHAEPVRNRFGGRWIAELGEQLGNFLGVIGGGATDLHGSGKMAAMLLSFHKSWPGRAVLRRTTKW